MLREGENSVVGDQALLRVTKRKLFQSIRFMGWW